MPIYGYQCSGCGHQKDVLQKLADPNLTECPACGADTFARQVSAPAFQLKGSGWYVTDFRDGDKGKPGQKDTGKSDGEKSSESSDSGSAKAGDSSKAASSDSKKSGSSDKSSSPAPAASSTDSSTSK